MIQIAILASGSGSNAENIARHFASSQIAKVAIILTNNPTAGVIDRAERLGIECVVFGRDDFSGSEPRVIRMLEDRGVDYIVLAGFLWLVPPPLIERYAGRIINIHPALLPKYGGKGMYGDRVHHAVVEAGETASGITIHHVNGQYDSGDIIAQHTIPVLPTDTPDDVAAKVHELEYKHFPAVIEEQIKKL